MRFEENHISSTQETTYNDNITQECTNGIHFFMDIKDAIAFAKM